MDWDGFLRAVADNCLVIPRDRTTGTIALELPHQASAGGLSPRQLLFSRAGDRSLLFRAEGQLFLPQRMEYIKKLFNGGATDAEGRLLLTRPPDTPRTFFT